MTAARGRAALAIGVAAVLVSSGCSTNGLASLPLPAPGLGSGGYTLTAVFANALNLPTKAKVKLAGADVGQVESMVARNYTAVTTLRIRDGVLLPRGSTAELRTATPLGDVFVALKPPADDPADTPMLRRRRHHRFGINGGGLDRRIGAGFGRGAGQWRNGAQFHRHHQWHWQS